MMTLAPYRICRLLGHKRVGYDPDGHPDSYRWNGRRRWYSRCARCGTTDGGEVYREGLLEMLSFRRVRRAFERAKAGLLRWWGQDCPDCGERILRFGRQVGDHDVCDEIPF